MAKRLLRPVDQTRTEQLAIDELYVVKGEGDADNYVAWLYDDRPECCPVCNEKAFKVHDRFSRTYTDYIDEGNDPRIINLEYQFYKYRCLNPECGRIFAAEISFATVNDNVTHRLENRIADMVIAGWSYDQIAEAFGKKLSKQAVGQIFNRWTQFRNEKRRQIHSPDIIGAISGSTDKEEYTLVFSCRKEKGDRDVNAFRIYVQDILLGVDSERIVASLRLFGGNATHFILTDCHPTIYAAAKEALPKAVHIIPAELWFKLVRHDYVEYIHPTLRWLPNRNKQHLMLEPRSDDEENWDPQLKRMFDARKKERLKDTYHDYHYMRDRIMDREFRWTIDELDEIRDELFDPKFCEQMAPTFLQYTEYRDEIARQEDYREIVPETILFQTDRLEELIRDRRTFSEEALQAAVLYSTEPDEKDDPENWQGIRIEKIIKKLTELQEGSRRRSNDYE